MPSKQSASALKAEKRLLFSERWENLAPELQTKTQLIGKTAVGCGATHHVMERCNFACTCCYLSSEANHTEPLPFGEVKEQIDQMRAHFGPGGKIQITAGEVTLLPVEDLGRIVAYAIGQQLDPMVMTHGQRFLDEPEYLFKLVRKYGLSKISIHIDTTQRGRRGYDGCSTESDLHVVRDRCADLIRRVRKETGRPLEAASTVTVTSGNLSQMHTVVDWFLRNCDAFRMLSFQPVADVGRTRRQQTEVEVDNSLLWDQVEAACGQQIYQRPMHFGHPDCNTTVPMVVAHVGSDRVLFEGLRAENEDDATIFAEAVERIGPAMDWTAPASRNAISLAGIYLRSPGFLARTLSYGVKRSWSERAKCFQILSFMVRKLRIPRIKPFIVVVHNFMSSGELDTQRGKERLDACVFKLPVDGKMISMCEMNASGLRAKIDRMQVRAKVGETIC